MKKIMDVSMFVVHFFKVERAWGKERGKPLENQSKFRRWEKTGKEEMKAIH
jgi:hypothetical protein